MTKKISAAFLSVLTAFCLLTGCGVEIQGHDASIISQQQSDESQSSVKDGNDGSIVPFYDSNAQKADNIDYLKADNMKFYLDRLVIAGDSIADGWQYYGVVPQQRCIAKGGLTTSGFSIWNEFQAFGKNQNMSQVLKQANPTLLYICLGMNDINQISADTYASQYRELINRIRSIIPDCLIVVQSITPVAATNQYSKVSNSAIKQYNSKLRQMVVSLNREDVIYFNAYNSLLGENSMMDPQYDAGDGLHINTQAYKKLLEDLSKRLNQELANLRLQAYEKQRSQNS